MKKVLGLVNLQFLPSHADLALLILRVWLGVCMLTLHGWGKLMNFSDRAGSFSDPLGIGSQASLVLAIFGEVVCSILLALGLMTRFAATAGAITMAVAFFMAHGGKLSGPGNGEMAFIYLMGYVVILVAGPGRFALDTKCLGNKA